METGRRATRLRFVAVCLAVTSLVVPGCSRRSQLATSRTPAAGDSALAGVPKDTSQASASSDAFHSEAHPQAMPRVVPATSSQVMADVHASGTPVTLVNVWATWCAPCREEFPDLVRFERNWRGRGVRVIFVSADFEDQLPEVREFLAKHGVTGDTWIKTGDDMRFINGLDPKWSGALPATFVYDRDGKLLHFWEGMG